MSGVAQVSMLRLSGIDSQIAPAAVVEERGVALLYNGRSFAALMATPLDLEDLAIGFSLSEGIIKNAGQAQIVDRVENDDGVALHLAIPQARFDALRHRRRAILMSGSCGLCGLESLAQLTQPPARVQDSRACSIAQVRELMVQMQAAQPISRDTGGAHAAACQLDSGFWLREDVGRHNALDKLIGALARAGESPPECIAVSARASFELVHKCATAKVPVLAAISAPTSAAVRLAETVNLSLLAFVRGEAMNVYSHAWRCGFS